MGWSEDVAREHAREQETGIPGPGGVGAGVEPRQPDPDEVESLGDEIVTLAAHMHAASHRLMELLLRFDRMRGWEAGGHRSCAHWLSFSTGLDLGTAREHVRVARALEALPRTSATMARGELSFSQARALTRVADASSEAALLELARDVPTARLEVMVRAWKRGTRQDEAERERALHGARTLSVFPDDEGMYTVRGRLTPEVGAMLMRAIEAAGDALYHEGGLPGESHDTEREAARLRADAMGLLAERALAAGFGEALRGCRDGAEAGGRGDGTEAGGRGAGTEARGRDDGAEAGSRDDDPEACGCPTSAVPLSGARAERYQVILHVDAATLAAGAAPRPSPVPDRPRVSAEAAEQVPGRSHLEDGTRVSAETSRRLSCDVAVVRVTRGADGSVLDVGRKTRSIPPALRRALDVRDGGCRFPGCGLRFTEGHHVKHWGDGGATSLSNCLLLCRFHHRLVHEDGWRVEWWGEGRAAFVDPRGQAHFDGGWRPPAMPERPVEELVARNRMRGVAPDPWRLPPRWKSEADIPDEVLLGAMEAVG